jgi:hypothetical protein
LRWTEHSRAALTITLTDERIAAAATSGDSRMPQLAATGASRIIDEPKKRILADMRMVAFDNWRRAGCQ